MNVLMWHVHGSYTTALVQGRHTYLLPVEPGRGEDGRGRAQTWEWPATAVEVDEDACADADVDVVVLQRPRELEGLAERWLGGRRPGRDVPAVYLEHNAPQGRVTEMRHVAADRDDLVLVHVTHFNDLFWDAGRTRTRVIEHGVVDPGPRYSGELARAAAVVNEPVRRGRVTGTDLLHRLAANAPLDVFGMATEALRPDEDGRRGREAGAGGAGPNGTGANGAGPDGGAPDGGITSHGDVPQERMHAELARRRVYVHPVRWTSLGLSLLEAMHLGMPVVALATTEVAEAVPPGAGVVSTDVDRLASALQRMCADPDAAREYGRRAREAALARYGLGRFLSDWDELLAEVTS